MTSPKPCPDMPTEIWAIPYPFSEWRHTSEQACHVARMDGCGNPTKYVRADLAAPSQWQTIDTAPRNMIVLLGCFNGNGKWRTMRGRWFDAGELLDLNEEPWDSPEGWYEESAMSDDLPNVWAVNASHWQPLPLPPTKDLADAGKEGV